MKTIIFTVLFLLSVTALADTEAKIKRIAIIEDPDLVYVYPEGDRVNNPPPCHGSNGEYISFSLNRPKAKEFLATLLVAFAAKKTVFFRTAGDCIDQSISDTLVYFWVNND
ncbi:hypothetical protein C8R27_13713 [Nitrosomonas ureae]|uniref:hypothetical protein n=1 Tax=Nitrosomonas ureae TaxID=44577 RepID=UPI000D753ED0|nr:hypothetical protein [Nitrosomonas ureae]PXX09488.1 hypothetical protein C8R27_13713 [Nitrosomonas ureae]